MTHTPTTMIIATGLRNNLRRSRNNIWKTVLMGAYLVDVGY